MSSWSARALAKQVDLPPSTVLYWIRSGLVRPDEFGRGRRGHSIGVSGLLELVAVRDLRAAGASIALIRRAVENLRAVTGIDRPLAPLRLVVLGEDVTVLDEDDLPVSVLKRPTQRVMVFPIGEEHAQILDDLNGRLNGREPSPEGVAA